MEKLRVGLIGAGGMGTNHARAIYKGEAGSAELTAFCDASPGRIEEVKKMFPGVKAFSSEDELISSGLVDGVIIATPHYQHPPIAVKAFGKGLHVLIEKPAGVYTKQVREMNSAAEKSGKVFSIMFQLRTNPVYAKAKDLLDSGELGEIKRMVWICTAWYRPQSYYDSGSWRGTWEGEGGGVLLNQAPHQLDLWQWICGVPSKIYAVCGFGKHREVEVEDDVTILGEYSNGAECAFISSTAEAPGTNRLEISADGGKLVIENNKLDFWRLRVPEKQFNRDCKSKFSSPECWKCEVPVSGPAHSHKTIIKNWTEAILNGSSLIAPGSEGINSLEISNAAYLSGWTGEWVDVPIDDEFFYKKLRENFKKRA
jgi:predicted dehydrogenase